MFSCNRNEISIENNDVKLRDNQSERRTELDDLLFTILEGNGIKIINSQILISELISNTSGYSQPFFNVIMINKQLINNDIIESLLIHEYFHNLIGQIRFKTVLEKYSKEFDKLSEEINKWLDGEFFHEIRIENEEILNVRKNGVLGLGLPIYQLDNQNQTSIFLDRYFQLATLFLENFSMIKDFNDKNIENARKFSINSFILPRDLRQNLKDNKIFNPNCLKFLSENLDNFDKFRFTLISLGSILGNICLRRIKTNETWQLEEGLCTYLACEIAEIDYLDFRTNFKCDKFYIDCAINLKKRWNNYRDILESIYEGTAIYNLYY